MTFPLPCRSGKAVLLTTCLLASLISLGLLSTFGATAAFATPSAVKVPKKHRPALSPLTAIVPGKSIVPVQTLLVHDHLTALGTNNGVRFWVYGDGSHANLRVRLLATTRANSPAADPLPRDEWISEPIPISFTGWHEVVLPQSNFTLRAAPPLPKSLDLALPADAQMTVADTDMAAATPDWSAATGLAFDVTTARQTTLIVDDLAWVTLDASGQGTTMTPILSGDLTNIGAWKPVGTPDETNAVVYSLATQAGQTHGSRAAFRWTITPPGLDRKMRQSAAMTVLNTTGKSCLVWLPPTLFTPILPSSLPPAYGTGSEVSLTACPEQTQAASFCLYSPAALHNVIVTLPGDLLGIGHSLPKSVVDVRVVKVRSESGEGTLRDPDTAGAVPELLVKDDRIALSGLAPEIRLTGPAVCDIPADTSKQFWLTVSVPRNTPPGNYVGKMIVSGRGLSVPFSVRLVLNVLPLRLLSPAKQYGINLRSRLDAPPAVLPSLDGRDLVTDFVTKDVLDAQLADIYAHGFTIATLYDSPDTLWDAVTEYQKYGLGTAYNLYRGKGDPSAIETQRTAHAGPPLTYYTDPEPNDAASARMAPLEKAGIPNVTYIPRQADFDALNANADIVVYNRDSEYPQQLLRTHGLRLSLTRDWWYWPATDADPLTNRIDSGCLLWKSFLYGAYVPDYQTAFGTDPYDETSAGACPAKSAYRPLMLTYPVKGGVLDTLQWEACREGVNDVRYLTTMYAALRECKDAKIAQPLVTQAETYVKTFLDKPLANLPENQYDAFRVQVATYAVQLRMAVDTYNKAPGLRENLFLCAVF